jgi:transcriptional regulator with XRE-family HTH domain
MDLARKVGRMPEFSGPMLRRRELGSALRRIRDERGMTIAEVTAAMQQRYGSSFSVAKLSRMETARRAVIPRDVHDLCAIYEVSDEERERLVEMAVEAHKGELSLRNNQVRDYLWFATLEKIASGIREYTAIFIPGLLQTPEYARAVENLQVTAPAYYSSHIDPGSILKHADDRVTMRLDRQEILTQDDPVHLHAVIDEGAIRRRLADPEIMKGQLNHLVELSKSPNIRIQIMPFEAGLYPGAETTNWSILDFPDGEGQPPRTVYLEAATGVQITERDVDVSRMTNAFEALAQMALNPSASRDLIIAVLAMAR